MPSHGDQPDDFEVDPESRSLYTLTITPTDNAEAVARSPKGSTKPPAINGLLDDDVSLGDGVYFNHPGVAVVTWDPTIRAARIEWQGWANPTEFAAANEAITCALQEHHGSRALGDCRNMKAIQQSDQDWAAKEWLPRAISAGLTRMALVIAKSGLAQMNVENVIARVPGTKLAVGYFETVKEAADWLRGQPTIPPINRVGL